MDLTSEKTRTFPRTLGAVLFSIGILMGFVFLGYTVWADIEATLFASSYQADKSLRSLNCPLILTSGETGSVSAEFQNNTERPIRPLVRTYISEGLVTVIREMRELIPIPSGRSEERSWEVNYGDAVYNRFILVRVTQHGHYPVPSQTGSCGIITLDVPFLSGSAIVFLITALIGGCIFFGLRLWLKYNRPLMGKPKTITQGFVWLSIVLAAGLLFTFLGWWVAAALFFILTLLLTMGISTHVFLTA